MEEVTRKRIIRQLETLPEEQLYQVLDYIEFLVAKHAAAAARSPDAFQRFAERVEDQMRVRSLAPKAMKGTMKIMSTAGKVIEGVRDLGRDLVSPGKDAPVAAVRATGEPATPDSAEEGAKRMDESATDGSRARGSGEGPGTATGAGTGEVTSGGGG